MDDFYQFLAILSGLIASKILVSFFKKLYRKWKYKDKEDFDLHAYLDDE